MQDQAPGHLQNQPPVAGLILPCYNEEAILPRTISTLVEYLTGLINNGTISGRSFLAFIDDGSKDGTWQIIDRHHNENRLVRGLKLAANAGHQKALLAGLMSFHKEADFLISMDADLEDDYTVIGQMIESWKAGHEIVYGVRASRPGDTGFKRGTAHLFYRLMTTLGAKLINNHADFRLAGRRALEELERFREVNLFLRGIFPLLGFSTSLVYYERKERAAGETKYPLKKMISFALDGITSFSVRPLRIVSVLGFIVFAVSLVLSAYVLISYFAGNAVVGWVSTVLPMYFLGGIQLLSVGIIGEYIGKIYTEVKDRPRYIIEKKLD